MSILPIRLYPDPALRTRCVPVSRVTEDIRKLLSDMAETMYDAPGIGLAAPQVGITERIIVVDVGEDTGEEVKPHLLKLINPEIVLTEGSIESEEGCLSIPDIRETVKRYSRVVLKAVDENEKEVRIDAHDLLAICIQHEVDHLNGVLFIDHLSRLKKNLIRSRLKRMAEETP